MGVADQGPRLAALEQALAAARFAQTDPTKAQRLARSAVRAAPGDAEVAAAAERALGMAAATRGDLTRAAAQLRRSAEIAEAANLPTRSGEAHGTLAYVLLLMGGAESALRELDRAEATAPQGLAAARLHMQRGLVLEEMHRLDEAAASLDLAVATVHRAGSDDLLEGDARTNRAIVRTSLTDWDGATEDLRRAEVLYTRNDHAGRTAVVHHNRGNLEARRGDLPAALAAFDEAATRYRQAGLHPGLLSVERAEALLSAGLVVEARQAAEVAVAEFAQQRNAVDLVQARLVLAEAALLGNDTVAARRESELARRAAQRQGRPHWAALAGYLLLRVRWLDGERTRASLTAARRTAAELGNAGWTVQYLDARLVAARIALDLGRPDEARRELEQVGSARRSGPAELRARAWYAEAILRRSDGDRAGAAAAVRSGLTILYEFQAGLGATDMRAHAATHAAELARLGLELAVESRRAESIFAAAERGRGGALRFRSARPPDDTGLVADLAELREVVTEMRSGRGVTGALLARRTAIEERIRDRARHAVGSSGAHEHPTGSQLHEALRDSRLVEYLDLDGEVLAVVIARGRFAFRRLGRLADAARAVAALRAGLHWLVSASGSERSSAAMIDLVHRSAQELDEMLLAPVLAQGDDTPLVIVPTGALHTLPWSALPSCTRRAVSIAPSAALWHRAATDVRISAGLPVLAYGPGLHHAAAEVAAVARVYDNAIRLGGKRASVSAVVAALDGAGVAHLASHGSFRSDNPMFSELRFADGPLTIYDLEGMAAPPRQVVLASCESGLSQVHTGDELIGLSAALLALGSVNLVAAVVPVPDKASRTLMVRFHRHLAAGRTAAAALADARRDTTGAGATPAALAAAAGFVCFGAG
jgi:tetratricopeptide (TPR) repeat protein